MGLINTLSAATSGLAAAEYGLNVTGQNIANLNTVGYARRTVDFVEVPPGSGGGVAVAQARAVRDALLEARIRQQFPAEEQQGAIATSLVARLVSMERVKLGQPVPESNFHSERKSSRPQPAHVPETAGPQTCA